MNSIFNKILGFIMLAFLCLPQAVDALGVSPSSFNYETVLVNQKINSSFLVSRKDVDNTQDYEIKVSGDGKQFIQLPSRIILDKGQNKKEVDFTLNLDEADNKKYHSKIKIRKVNSEEQNKVSAGTTINLNFSVTSKKMSAFKIKNVDFKPSKKNQKAEISFLVDNEGNTVWTMDKIELNLDSDKEEYSHIFTDIPEVSAKNKKFINLEYPARLNSGQYEAVLGFVKGEKSVYSTSGKLVVYEDSANTKAPRSESVELKQVNKEDIKKADNFFEKYAFAGIITIILMLLIVIYINISV